MPKQISDKAVFEATVETLMARGYAGATTKLIAQAAGINEVTLFRKYGNKAQLVAAAVGYNASQLELVPYSGDVRHDLLRVVEAYLFSAEKHGSLFPVIMSEMARYPELRDTLDGPFAVVGHIGQLIARYQEEGALFDEPPLTAVGALLGPLIVYRMFTSVPAKHVIPDVDLESHVDRFLAGRNANASA